MTNMKEERLLEVPTEEDESVGDLPVKKQKKRKSKEEREADRKVIFWTMVVIIGITLFFWAWPRIREFKFGLPEIGSGSSKTETSKPEKKNYIEYKL